MTATEPELILSGARLATGLAIFATGFTMFGVCYFKALANADHGSERRGFYYLAASLVAVVPTIILGALVMSGFL